MRSMLIHPEFDPVALNLGGIRVHWYGVMYLLAFLMAWGLGTWRAKDRFRGWTRRDMDDVVFYVALGIILGGRLGYVLFYAPAAFLKDPAMLFQVWQGGMSFHGGLLGTMFAMWLFARRRNWGFFQVADFVAPLVPLGLGAGRIGNFINGNLWGLPSDLPWAMVFPRVDEVARHPSQLYEALLEGLILFAIVWLFSRRPRPLMSVSALFLLGYGVFRFLVEFVRVPDEHIGYLAFDWLTIGHLLTLPMIIFGGLLLWLAYRNNEYPKPLPEAHADDVPAAAETMASSDAKAAAEPSRSAGRAKSKGRKRRSGSKRKNRR